jgi:hypothetical protein
MKTLSALKLFAVVMLIGCATPYGPHQLVGGYSHVRIQNDVFPIVFDADTDVRTTNVFIPGQTFATSNTYGTGYAHATAGPIGRNVYASGYGQYNASTSTTVPSTRSYSTALQKPVVTLDIQTLPGRIDPCLKCAPSIARSY